MMTDEEIQRAVDEYAKAIALMIKDQNLEMSHSLLDGWKVAVESMLDQKGHTPSYAIYTLIAPISSAIDDAKNGAIVDMSADCRMQLIWVDTARKRLFDIALNRVSGRVKECVKLEGFKSFLLNLRGGIATDVDLESFKRKAAVAGLVIPNRKGARLTNSVCLVCDLIDSDKL